MTRTRTLLAVALLALTVTLAGCTAKDDAPTTPAPSGNPNPAPTPAPTNDQPATTPRPAAADQTDTQTGEIAGPFERSFDVNVPSADYKTVQVAFQLLPMQPGAPVTARAHVSLNAADGTPLKTATLGLGGQNALDYMFAPGELAAGTYTLTVTAEQTEAGGVPTLGFANWEFSYLTDY